MDFVVVLLCGIVSDSDTDGLHQREEFPNNRIRPGWSHPREKLLRFEPTSAFRNFTKDDRTFFRDRVSKLPARPGRP